MARRPLRTAALLLALLALADVAEARAQAAAMSRQMTPQKARRPRGDRAKLTRVEIDGGGCARARRPCPVRVRRPMRPPPPMGRIASSNLASDTKSATQVVVYIDDLRQPSVDPETSLITVPAARLVEIRYLDQNRAVQLRGPGHEAGVIEVTTLDKRK